MATTPFTPVDFVKGNDYKRVLSWADYYQAVWDGYQIVGSVPTPPVTGNIPRSLMTAKGDLLAGTATGQVGTVILGADGQVLTADSTQPNGVKWAPGGGTGINTAVQTALNLKADLTALAAKADASAMTTALGLKADASAMTTALAAKADASAMTTALAAKADAVATQAAIDAKGLVASSRDHSGVASALNVGSYGLLLPRISIPPSTVPILVSYGANVLCTAAGTGLIGIGFADITDGTTKQQSFASRNGTFASTGTFAPLLGSIEGEFELDPSVNWRHLRLVGGVFRDSGSLAASAMSGASSGAPSYQPYDRAAYLRAVAV